MPTQAVKYFLLSLSCVLCTLVRLSAMPTPSESSAAAFAHLQPVVAATAADDEVSALPQSSGWALFLEGIEEKEDNEEDALKKLVCSALLFFVSFAAAHHTAASAGIPLYSSQPGATAPLLYLRYQNFRI